MAIVAAVQFKPEFKNTARNIREMAKLVVQAANGGAKLIVMPELATTGYSFMSKADAEPFAEEVGQAVPHNSQYVMRELAKRLGVHIVWGLVAKDGMGDLFNSQMYVGPEGEFTWYHKVNPFGNDFLWMTPGRANPPIVDIDFGGTVKRVGLLICRDIRNEKDANWTGFYEPGEADVIAFSAAWGDGGFPATIWMDFARNNKVCLVVSNRYGLETPNDFGEGGVCVIYPEGKVNCEGLSWNQDCIVYSEV